MKTFDPRRAGVPGHFANFSKLALMGLGLTCASVPALAADSWIACDGAVVTKIGSAAPTSAPVSDFYAYDDDIKALYKYHPKRQSLDLISIKTYDAKAIVWTNVAKGMGAEMAQWEGRLDRAKMALKIVYEDTNEVMTWTQTCKPASAQPLKQ